MKTDPKVELNLDGEWVDASLVGNGVLSRDPITVKTGRSDWSSRTDTSQASFTLADRDGRWSPDLASGAYSGKYRRNIPVRIGVGAGDSYLTSNGSVLDLASTPNVGGAPGGSPSNPVVESITTSDEAGAFTTTHDIAMPATVNPGDRLVLLTTGGHSSFAPTSDFDDWTSVFDRTLHGFHRWHVMTYYVPNSGAATALESAVLQFSSTVLIKSDSQVYRVSGATAGGLGSGYATSTVVSGFGTAPDASILSAPGGSTANLYIAMSSSGGDGATVSAYPFGWVTGDPGTPAAGLVTATAYLPSASPVVEPGAFTLSLDENWEAAALVFPAAPVPGTPGSLDVAGDFEARIEFQLHQDLVDVLSESGDRRLRLAARINGAAGWMWELLNYDGEIHTAFIWYDSSGVAHRYETVGVARLPFSVLHDRSALRVTLDVDNGSTDSTARFYYSDGIDGTWTEVGDGATGVGVTDIGVTDASLHVAAEPGDTTWDPITGKTFAFRLYDGIGGTVVANPDFTSQPPGATGFTDSAGAVWTIGAGGQILNTRWRFTGELASLPVRWNVDGSDVWAPVEAAGLFRRLRQGNRRLESPLRRGVLRSAPNVVQYWPCEEQGGGYITRFGAAIGSNPIVVTNAVPNTGANRAFAASDPLPTLGDSVWTATVDPYPVPSEWQVRWLQSIPEGFTDDGTEYGNVILEIRVHTGFIWQICYRDDNGGDLRIRAGFDGVEVYASAWATFGATGTDWRMHFSVKQSGNDLDVVLVAQDPRTGLAGGIFPVDLLPGFTADQPTILRFNKDVNCDGVSIGHVTLQSVVDDIGSLATELQAHDAEPAGERIVRLCTEEGIPYRIQGDPAATELMGPQTSKPFMDLLEECAATDLGILFEPRETSAVGYRTFGDVSNQGAVIEIDYAARQTAGPVDLDRDDQGFANDVTVENASGTTARAVLDDGSPLSVSEPPVGSGRYDTSVSVNAQDDRLPVLAGRVLALSTPDEPRVSKLRLGLHYPGYAGLVDATLDARLGDLVTVENNLPVALGSTTIRQILQGTTDRIGHYEHYVDCLTSPASPWLKVPGPVTDLSAGAGQVAVLLTWSEPFNDGPPVEEYDVERSAVGDSTGFTALATVPPGPSYTDTTVTADVQYWYRVRAVSDAGDGPWSNVATATPTGVLDPPAAVTDLSATAAGSTIDLAWSAPSSTETITSYDIQRSDSSDTGPWTDVEIDLSPTTTYADTGLSAGEYWYRVRATSSEGDGPWSNIDSDTATATANISIVGTSEFDGTSTATTHDITLPSGIQADDLICIWSSTQSSTSDGAPTAPGFSQRYSQGHAVSFRPLVTLLHKKATGSESSTTVTLTWGVACDANMVCVVFRGVDTTTPFDQTEPASTNGTSNPDPASITTVTDGAWVVHAVAANRVGTMPTISSISSGYTVAYSQVPDLKSIVVAYKEKATAGADDGSAWSWATLDNHTSTVTALRPGAGGGGGGGSGTPAPTVPSFSSTVTITAGQNVKSIIEAAAAGTHFTLAAGTHTNCENVKLKTNMHVRLATGCVLEGSGKGYCFRPLDQAVTGVAIGGDPAGARPIIRNYGNGTSSQEYGAIMGRTDDALSLYPTEPEFVRRDVDDWFIYHLDFEKNSSNGVKLGSNWTVYDCEFHGHSVTGIQGDRVVGGLVHSCLFYWNALNPASGIYVNGAHIKYTWLNADEGRTSQTPIDRTKADHVISNCTFEAFDRDGGPGACQRGVWFDLDCKQALVEYCSFDDLSAVAVYAEGCNDIEGSHLTVRNTAGFGNALGQDFVNGALCAAESTNVNFHDCTLIDCGRAMVNRMSNRSADWYNSNDASFANYSWPTGPRYWIDATGRGVTPSPTARANMWTGGNSWVDNTLINCGRVMINEGTNGGGMTCVGATPNDLTFSGNDYSGSPSIQFFDRSNSALNLAAWQGLGYDT